MIKRDDLHYTTRKIDGYNMPFNFIISEREAGKSTAIWLDKAYKAFKEKKYTTLVIRRKVVHITKSYIDDICKIINKFTDDKVTFKYALSTLKEGIVDINIEGDPFLRIVSLSVDITALKSLVLLNLDCIVFDEFICNPKFGEKYLKNEAYKFLEVYNTFRRECVGTLKCYFLGNPYSLYNPYFVHFDVPTAQLKPNTIVSDGKSYVVECYQICPELKVKILAENPLYQFENAYTAYAFNGLNVNDQNIIILKTIPIGYQLKYIFKIQGKYIGIHQNQFYIDNDNKYYVKFLDSDTISKRRDIYAFDFDELVNHTIMLSRDEKYKFEKIKNAMRRRNIAFQSIECYYLTEEIYFNL